MEVALSHDLAGVLPFPVHVSPTAGDRGSRGAIWVSLGQFGSTGSWLGHGLPVHVWDLQAWSVLCPVFHVDAQPGCTVEASWAILPVISTALTKDPSFPEPNTPAAAGEEGAAISVPPVACSGCRDKMRWVALPSDSCPTPPETENKQKGR